MMRTETGDFGLHEASNGDSALIMAPKLQPSVLLIDAMMRGALSGFEVCRRIKDRGVLKHTAKVILLAAMSQSSDRRRGQAAGCDAYLTKPFNPIELLDTVDRLATTDRATKDS
jgi:hypothetical protein